jgi:nickel-dependent lactate racemase
VRIDLPYGEKSRELLMPAGVAVDHVSPPELGVVEDLAAGFAAACREPVDAGALETRLGAGTKVLIVVSDITRSPATRELLPVAVDYVASRGVARSDVRVLVARGTHRSLTKEEKVFFRGPAMKGIAVDEHDCDDARSHKALTLTKRGTPVRINRALREAGVVMLLSPVSFHYFAGFGGGRKLIMPGCADRQSILANHRLSLRDTHPVTLHPSCRPGNLDGNPVHDDMVEVVRTLGHLFAVNFFTDARGRVAWVNAGEVVASHAEACSAYASRFRVELPVRAPVVVAGAGGWPHDINLLQAHKALYHAARAAREGASILLYARCAEGVGSESLLRAIERPRKKFFDDAWSDYALNNQTGVSLLGLTRRYRVAMVTELDEAVTKAAGIERCVNAEAWVAAALEGQAADRMCTIPHAGMTLPYEAKELTT